MAETAKLTASDGISNAFFGVSVAISESMVIVGAIGGNVTHSGAGSVYIFVEPAGAWTGMTQTAELTASDGVNGVEFGDAVSISGSTAIVGAINFICCNN